MTYNQERRIYCLLHPSDNKLLVKAINTTNGNVVYTHKPYESLWVTEQKASKLQDNYKTHHPDAGLRLGGIFHVDAVNHSEVRVLA